MPACTYPLTGVAYVRRVYTDHAVFELRADGVHVVDTFGCGIGELRSRMDVELHDAP